MMNFNDNQFFRDMNKLHVMSTLEGMLITLKPGFLDGSFRRKERAKIMIKFKPKTFEITLLGKRRDPLLYTNYVKDTLKLRESAEDFFSNNLISPSNSVFAPTKVIVKNISFKVKQKELWAFFEHYGKVLRATIVTVRRSKRSRGFGFVVFASQFAAEKALKAKKADLMLGGRCMLVSPAGRKKTKEKSMYSASRSFKNAISDYMRTTQEESVPATL